MVMLFCFSALSLFWVWRKSFLAISTATISQLPFWIGSMVFFDTGQTPVQLNIVTDLAASTAFVFLAYQMRRNFLVCLGILFVSLGLVDVYASLFGMLLYFELHVAAHALALILIIGRGAIDRIDWPLSNRPSRLAD